MILCTTEIFIYLEENLKLTPQNLSEKAAATDELEEIYQQVYSENHFDIPLNQSVVIDFNWFCFSVE